MTTTRAILKRLTDAAHKHADVLFMDGDDENMVMRSGEALDRALAEADAHLDQTARRPKLHSQGGEPK